MCWKLIKYSLKGRLPVWSLHGRASWIFSPGTSASCQLNSRPFRLIWGPLLSPVTSPLLLTTARADQTGKKPTRPWPGFSLARFVRLNQGTCCAWNTKRLSEAAQTRVIRAALLETQRNLWLMPLPQRALVIRGAGTSTRNHQGQLCPPPHAALLYTYIFTLLIANSDVYVWLFSHNAEL